jgi:hypothetical protein
MPAVPDWERLHGAQGFVAWSFSIPPYLNSVAHPGLSFNFCTSNIMPDFFSLSFLAEEKQLKKAPVTINEKDPVKILQVTGNQVSQVWN